MGRKAKVVEVSKPVVEEPATIHINLDEPKLYHVILNGRLGGVLEGSVNGALFSLPCGVELSINEGLYSAVQAHIKSERK